MMHGQKNIKLQRTLWKYGVFVLAELKTKLPSMKTHL